MWFSIKKQLIAVNWLQTLKLTKLKMCRCNLFSWCLSVLKSFLNMDKNIYCSHTDLKIQN